MIFMYIFNSDGSAKLSQQVDENIDMLEETISRGGSKFACSKEYYSISNIYLDNGKVTKLPPQPSPGHVFDYTIKQWVANAELAAANVRDRRDQLIKGTDWTQGRDIADDVAARWAPYRQALRDITAQPGFPMDVVWPVAPSN